MDEIEYKKFIKTKYDSGLSFAEISNLINEKGKITTYPNKIRRDYIKFGYKPRSKAEAQANALFYGKQEHPTKGRQRTEEEKIKISDNKAAAWKNMSPEEREKYQKKAKKRWEKMSVSQKDNLKRKAAAAVRKAADEGSKMEKIVFAYFTELGFPALFHQEIKLIDKTLEVDIFVPGLNLAIEIDGPIHFLPIWGEEALAKKVNSDNEKNGILLSSGYSVVRFKSLIKKISFKYIRNVKKVIQDHIPTWKANMQKPTLYQLEA